MPEEAKAPPVETGTKSDSSDQFYMLELVEEFSVGDQHTGFYTRDKDTGKRAFVYVHVSKMDELNIDRMKKEIGVKFPRIRDFQDAKGLPFVQVMWLSKDKPKK